jgi:hypothetical protein
MKQEDQNEREIPEIDDGINISRPIFESLFVSTYYKEGKRWVNVSPAMNFCHGEIVRPTIFFLSPNQSRETKFALIATIRLTAQRGGDQPVRTIQKSSITLHQLTSEEYAVRIDEGRTSFPEAVERLCKDQGSGEIGLNEACELAEDIVHRLRPKGVFQTDRDAALELKTAIT